MINNQALLTGILAGCAAGLMIFGAFNAGLFAIVLLFAAPAAIYIATMGWGSGAGLVAAFTGTLIAGWFGGMPLGAMSGGLLFAPAAYIGHLVNLGTRSTVNAANDNAGGVVWFPLSIILMRLMFILAAGFIIIGAFAGLTDTVLSEAFTELLKTFYAANPDLPALEDAVFAAHAATYAKIFPIALPCLWLMMHVATAFVSANITRRSGLLAREPEDVAATVKLPAEAAIMLVAGLVGEMVFSGTLQLAAAVLLGIGIGGFGLIGLAHLHFTTRGNPMRSFLIWATYGSIILFSVPLFIFTAIGLFRSFNASNRKPSGPTKNK
jgi:hypothetical protein